MNFLGSGELLGGGYVVDRDKVGRILKGSEWAKFWGRPGADSVLVCWEMQPTLPGVNCRF